MELFQTIWTALTTENEFLSRVVIIPEIFIETLVNMLIFTALLNIKSIPKQKIYYVLSVSIIGNLCNLFIPNPLRSFINLGMIFICIKFILNVNIFKSILATILPILVTVLCESIIVKISDSLLNINIINITTIPLYRLTYALCIQVLMFIVYLFIKYSKLQIGLLENMPNKSKFIVLSNLILAVIAIIIQFWITGFYINKLPIYIVLFSNLSLIAYFILSLYSLTKTTQLELTSLNLEQEKEQNRLLKLSQDDLHGFRHDFSNIMCTIGGYVQVNDMNGLSNYYSQIQKDINKVNNLGALNTKTINNPAVFALISSKYDEALELNIEMNINVFLDLNTLNMKIYEFTRVLGILLDNALEAAQDCEEKIVNIEIRKDSKRNRQILLVENTYLNKDVDTEKIFEKKYSTKPGNTGLGLWEVRQILKKNNNLNLFTSKDERFFKQQLEMYNL